ncbi:MAG: FAD-dependent oxidoreductase, partial [Clostridia bacterium]|nr:FAD-dependent oxidoreductase [Clostridia bacterium]
MSKTYDAIVVGAGHAGVEAAHALAAMGHNTLIISMTLDAIAFLACNPNIGGTGKGHLVKEVDALGGLMGELADKATIQTRMLNLGNGPAVHSLRAQVDKSLYHRLAKAALETTPNLTVLEGEAVSLLCENGAVCGIQTALGETLYAKAVILCTGVYLASRIITGEYVRDTGPNGFSRSGKLSQSLAANGLSLVRFKTGTPARILASSIDFSKM